uniref:ROK family protein n=1 Tax=Sphingomonas sp. TaxID=28214 RepID=UPI0025E98F2B
MPDQACVGGIELGGTKTVFAIGDHRGTILLRKTLPTRDPAAVVADAGAFFTTSEPRIEALGVGAFGPVVVDRKAPDFGHLLDTNKHGWSGFDLIGALAGTIPVPARLVTDVGAAAIGEARLGALRGIDLGVYLTVGTGIGGAIVCHGELLPALLHPEMGHVGLHRRDDDHAPSQCNFHETCAEGLVAGPAIMARFDHPLDRFAPGGPEFALVADYLGQLCGNLVLMLSPWRIVLGGGVGKTPGLAEATRAAMARQLGSYV